MCKDFYAENYKTLLGSMREELRKWRAVLRIERFNVVKMPPFPKMIDEFCAIIVRV